MIETRETVGATNISVETSWKTANPSEALGYSCEIRVSRGEDSGYVAYVATLPGVVGQGADFPSAVKDVAEALQVTLETYVEEKMPIPWRQAPNKRPDEETYQVIVNA